MARPKKDQSQEQGAESLPLYTVAIAFQDAREYCDTSEPKQYAVGDDVSHFDQERLDAAVQRGTVVYNAPVTVDPETDDTEA